MSFTRYGSIALLLGTVAVLGCGGGSTVAPVKVEGLLTYKGKPIPAGTMNFVTNEGTAYGALISSDGAYTATGLPEGEYVITVDTESMNPGTAEPTGGSAARYGKAMGGRTPSDASAAGPAVTKKEVYVKIPAKYGKKQTSPLTVTLKAGRQIHNVELTD